MANPANLAQSSYAYLELEAGGSNFVLARQDSDSDYESDSLAGHREIAPWIQEKALAIRISHESYVGPRLQSHVFIFKVPNFLKEMNEKAYVPQIVSLGPYHSDRENLSGMQNNKKRALDRMMKKYNKKRGLDSDTMEFSLRAIDKIFREERNFRCSYDENIDCSPECLAVMLTLDGCFILEILSTLGGDTLNQEDNDKYEPIFDRRKIDFTGFDILSDILMLENQIPLIVLRKLLQLQRKSVRKADNFLFDVLVKTPGNKFYPFDYTHDIRVRPSQPLHEEDHHLLGLLYRLIVSPHSEIGADRGNPIDDSGKENSGKNDRGIPTAVELSNAGIKFKPRHGGIKKIEFDEKEATLYLPPINVIDHTEVLFRNLIALELCKPSGYNYVSCYLCLMNKLIDTGKDVALLRKSEIVKNYLGSDAEAAELFNGLTRGVTLPPQDVFKKLNADVMKHYKSKFKVWFAQFMDDYVSTPWKILALAGAIIALLLSLVQTVCSILQVHK